MVLVNQSGMTAWNHILSKLLLFASYIMNILERSIPLKIWKRVFRGQISKNIKCTALKAQNWATLKGQCLRRVKIGLFNVSPDVIHTRVSALCKSACVSEHLPHTRTVLSYSPTIWFNTVCRKYWSTCCNATVADQHGGGGQQQMITTRCHSHYSDLTADWAVLGSSSDVWGEKKILEESTATTEQHSHDHNECQRTACLLVWATDVQDGDGWCLCSIFDLSVKAVCLGVTKNGIWKSKNSLTSTTVMTASRARAYKTSTIIRSGRSWPRERQSRSGQRGLANESWPELARIGGNKLRLGRMQTGRDRLRAEVARVERQKERQETHLVWKRGGEKKQETAPVPPSTPPPVLKQSSNGCVYRPSILLPLSTQRFEDRRRKKKKKKKRVY